MSLFHVFQSFNDRSTLYYHKKLHINKDNKPYQCGICSKVYIEFVIFINLNFVFTYFLIIFNHVKRFSLQRYLTIHFKMHNDAERIFSCHLCPMVILYYYLLENNVWLYYPFSLQ